MARFSRSRSSRTLVSAVVIAITIGAAYQFHHLRKSNAQPTPQAPPLGMSVMQTGGPITLVKPAIHPAIAIPSVVTPPPPITTLVTQTPDLNKPNPPKSILASAVLPPQKVAAATPIASPPTVVSSTLLGEASAKVAANDLLGARTMLNEALLSKTLSPTDTEAVKKQMSDINQTVIFSPRQFPKDPLGGVYTVQPGQRLSSIATAHQVPYELLLPLNRMTDARKLRYNQTLKVINGPFHVVVTKSKFTLDVYLGSAGGPDSTYITTFPVGLGTDNSTPTGTWLIKNKVTHPAYFPPEGHAGPVITPEDPKNPLGAYWMGLEGTDGQAVGQQSYGIHGTIDPSSIGKMSSMGCIRLRNEDVEWVYKLLIPTKSTVVVQP